MGKVTDLSRKLAPLPAIAALILGAPAGKAQPALTIDPTNQIIWSGGTASFSVKAAGAGALAYQWQFNSANLPLSMITTVAGNGRESFFGDGGPAADSGLDLPLGVAVGANGEIFIADTVNHRIRKIDTNGIITTIAGSGVFGYSGDGGPATNATLALPRGLAVDVAGEPVFSNWDDGVIRIIRADGTIDAFAGDGTNGCIGDGGSATNAEFDSPEGMAFDLGQNLFVTACNEIRKVDTNGVITAVAGYFAIPTDVAVDPVGNLYISDGGAAALFKVSAAEHSITKIAGGGTGGDGGPATNAGLSFITAVKLDETGNIYLSDHGNNRIRKIDTNGIITTIAGNGTQTYSGDDGAATNAALSSPWGIALDGRGNLYIADEGNNAIREVSFNGLPILTISNAGTYDVIITDSTGGSITSSVVTLTVVPRPTITITPTNQLIWTDSSVTLTSAITYSGPVSYQWQFNGSNLPGATAATLALSNVTTANAGSYQLIATGPANSGSVTSPPATLAVAIPPSNQVVWAGGAATLSAAVAGPGPFTYQWQINGTNLPPSLISNYVGNGKISFSGDGGPAINASINFPQGTGLPCGLAVDAAGNLVFPDLGNNRIRRVAPNGLISTIAGNGVAGFPGDGGPATNAELNVPVGVAIAPDGGIIIADCYNLRVRRIDPSGLISTVAGTGQQGSSGDGGPATKATLNYPIALTFDTAGNLYISEGWDVRKIDTNGIISTYAGGGTNADDGFPATNVFIENPGPLAFNPQGELFFTDSDSLLYKVDKAGIIHTVIGPGPTEGDGGPAADANLRYPLGLAFDSFGDLFIADSGHNAVREVEANGTIVTAAGDGLQGYYGDEGPATLARFAGPFGVALDSAGNLYIPDNGNDRIRKVTPNGLPTLPVGASGVVTLTLAGPSGSITSSPITVTATSSPLILATARQPDGSISLNLITAPNASSRLLAATNLSPPIPWQTLATNNPGPSAQWQFLDTNAPALPARFYRTATP